MKINWLNKKRKKKSTRLFFLPAEARSTNKPDAFEQLTIFF
jgi:hypothetical protein